LPDFPPQLQSGLWQSVLLEISLNLSLLGFKKMILDALPNSFIVNALHNSSLAESTSIFDPSYIDPRHLTANTYEGYKNKKGRIFIRPSK
jgi:hypothetical protein